MQTVIKKLDELKRPDKNVRIHGETADCCVVAGLSAKEKKKLMPADNKIFDLGANDTSAFDEILRELSGDVDIPGYDVNLLQSITVSFNAVPLNTISAESPPRIQVKVNSSSTEQSQPLQSTSSVEEHGQQNVQRFVTCQKCGEKIYL